MLFIEIYNINNIFHGKKNSKRAWSGWMPRNRLPIFSVDNCSWCPTVDDCHRSLKRDKSYVNHKGVCWLILVLTTRCRTVGAECLPMPAGLEIPRFKVVVLKLHYSWQRGVELLDAHQQRGGPSPSGSCVQFCIAVQQDEVRIFADK